MSTTFEHPHTEVVKIIAFLKETFEAQQKKHAVIAVSGGIDSALSLSLLTKALPNEDIFPILLPYADQSTKDSEKICNMWEIPKENIQQWNIQSVVDTLSKELGLDKNSEADKFRIGNLMARARMMFVYDLAKKLDALVVGTENKSEKYLGYFTRFGDEASDIEPIQHLYKTQVRTLVEHLALPSTYLDKAPSAGLWDGQSDESELGFSYEEADKVLDQYIDQKEDANAIQIEGVSAEKVDKIISRVLAMQFKHEVPYVL